jgi:hypothetical protein
LTDVSEVLSASIIWVMMEAVSTYETTVSFYQITWCSIPEDIQLHTHPLQEPEISPRWRQHVSL